MTTIVLFLMDRLAGVIRLLGGDYAQFRAILEVKLLQDSRRAFVTAGRVRRAESRNVFAWSLFIQGFFGLFLAAAMAMVRPPLTGLTLNLTAVMFMIGLSLIADYSSVLLDVTDLIIVLPRPVSSRTFLLARLAHIGTYLGLSTGAIGLASIVIGSVVFGGRFLAGYLPVLVLMNCLIVFGVNLFYAVALRFVNVERLKDAVVYIQVFLTLAVTLGYQILPRLIGVRGIGEVDLTAKWWIYFCPPAWLAGVVEVVRGNTGSTTLILAGLGVVCPILGIILVSRLMGPEFARGLARLSGGGAAAVAQESSQTTTQRQPDVLSSTSQGKIMRYLVRETEARAGFDLVWSFITRDRTFKLKVFPAIGMILIIPFFLVLVPKGGESLGDTWNRFWHEADRGHVYLVFLYATGFVIPALCAQLGFSASYEAAWLYHAVPLRRPGTLLWGALLAVIVRYVLPVFALFAILSLLLWGWRIAPDVLLAAVGLVVICLGFARLASRRLPFSEKPALQVESGRVLRNFVLVFFPVGLGFVHLGLIQIPGGVVVAIGVELLILLGLRRSYFRLGWDRF